MGEFIFLNLQRQDQEQSYTYTYTYTCQNHLKINQKTLLSLAQQIPIFKLMSFQKTFLCLLLTDPVHYAFPANIKLEVEKNNVLLNSIIFVWED